jgi:hypothetical protein
VRSVLLERNTTVIPGADLSAGPNSSMHFAEGVREACRGNGSRVLLPLGGGSDPR